MRLSLTCKHCKIDISADHEDELVTRVPAHVLTDEHVAHLPAHARTHGRRSELTREHILTRLHRRSPESMPPESRVFPEDAGRRP